MSFELYPEQVATLDRDQQLLAALALAQTQGVLRLPGPTGFEKLGTPPTPKVVTLVREERRPQAIDYGAVSWLPEMGFWPNLRQASKRPPS